MPHLKSTDVFLSLGRRGSGKSYIARRISEAYPRKVIFDSLGEYGDTDGIVCHSFDEFSERLIENANSPSFTLIYQFNPEEENNVDEFNQALRVLWYKGNVFIVIEEIQIFASTHNMCMWLKNALLTGRHRNIGLFFTTQRPGECHKTIISQANHVFCGSLHEKNDIDYARSVLGEKAYDLVALPDREFLYFRPGVGIIHIDNDLNSKNP